jgi:hypothetical protein
MSNVLFNLGLGAGFIAFSIAIFLASYILTRRALGAPTADDKPEAVATVTGRVITLFGLILALVYAQELENLTNVRRGLDEEAVAIADVFNDIRRYGGPEVAPVQADLAQYLQTVSTQEWDLLGSKRELSNKAWAEWEDAYDRTLDLTPSNERQRFLANRMRNRITEIARFRHMRASAAQRHFGKVFWIPALAGLCVLATPFCGFRPSRRNLVLLAAFGGYAGLILYMIYGFANPFTEPYRLEPQPFQRLLKTEIGLSLPRGGALSGPSARSPATPE